MKLYHTLTAVLLLTVISHVHAQSARYEDAMRKNVATLDTAKKEGTMQTLANNFQRIAEAEKTQWMPYYYAAYCIVTQGYANTQHADELADQAEKMIKKADSLSPKNSEVMCIYSMVNSARIMVDPQSRGMKYGMIANDYLQKAQKYNAANPRSYMLQGISLFYTPAQYGGGKDAAKVQLQKAADKFAAFKADPDYAPHWGAELNQKLLQQSN